MIRDFAVQLQALLHAYGISLPIVDGKPSGPAIALGGFSGGPFDGGRSSADLLIVDHPYIKLAYTFAEHGDSGQCNQWDLDVTDSTNMMRDPLRELFHPRHRNGHWGANTEPRYWYNGMSVGF